VPAADKVAIVVTINCGTANALQSLPVTVPTATATPEFLFWLKTASGKNPVIAINAVTFGYVGAPGASSAAIAPAANTPTVQLGSATLTINNGLLYAGISPGTAGLYQVCRIGETRAQLRTRPR